MSTPLRLAAVQFPVSGDIGRNLRYMRTWMRRAAAAGARVVQFPEAALCGYAPRHHGAADVAWQRLADATAMVCRQSAALGIWTIFGTMSRGRAPLPLNSLLVVSPAGRVAASYAKRRLYGDERRYYAPGGQACLVDIEGHRCGLLICYDNCYPVLFEEYREAGVGLLFLSFYNAGRRRQSCLADLMRANVVVRAADHGMWISASNSCERHSPLAAGIFRPDGSAVEARRHVTGMALDDYPAARLGWTYDNREAP